MVTNSKVFSADCSDRSSNLLTVEYSAPVRQLYITFQGGSKYQYNDVSPYHGEQFVTNPLYNSHGKHFHHAIKDRYPAINLKSNATVEIRKEPFTDEQIKQAYDHYANDNGNGTTDEGS